MHSDQGSQYTSRAFTEFCEEKGIMPITAGRRENADFGDFLGSFYTDTKKSQKMEKPPDRLKVYYPISKNLSLRYTNQKGQKGNWDVIHDVSNYPLAIKYSTFIEYNVKIVRFSLRYNLNALRHEHIVYVIHLVLIQISGFKHIGDRRVSEFVL